jgi:hypothetical protein
MSLTPQEFFQSIEALSPSFALVAEDHRKDYDGILPHLLMADLLRFVGSGLGGPNSLAYIQGVVPPSRDEIVKIMSALEDAYSKENPNGETALGNAIAISFVENCVPEPFFDELKRLFGPALQAELKAQQEWKPIWNHDGH